VQRMGIRSIPGLDSLLWCLGVGTRSEGPASSGLKMGIEGGDWRFVHHEIANTEVKDI